MLSEDIKRETNENVDVVKPKTYLIIGTSSQLVNDNMKNDFKRKKR